MNAYIHTMTATDENGEKAILYPRTKQNAVDGLEERLAKLEVADITETEDTTLGDSHAGRLKINEIVGAMEQGANPSPTNPQEIRNVAISGIRTHGKNFVNDSQKYNYYNNIFIGTTSYQRAYLHLKKGSYSVTCVSKSDSAKVMVESDTSSIAIGSIGTTSVARFTLGSSKYVEIYVTGGLTSIDDVVSVQLELGEETEYEPYTESTITFSQPIELYGMDDVRDILTSKQIKRKYSKVVFDGSDDEAWNGSSTVGRYYMNNWGCKGYGFLMCSQAKGVQNGNEELNTCYIHAASNGRFIINTEIPTFGEWKAHLASNPMTVVYELATETTEELPIADQIALNSLQTFDGITYVEFVSEIKPTFSAKYGTTEMGGMTLESLLTARSNDLRLSALETSVVNNI